MFVLVPVDHESLFGCWPAPCSLPAWGCLFLPLWIVSHYLVAGLLLAVSLHGGAFLALVGCASSFVLLARHKNCLWNSCLEVRLGCSYCAFVFGWLTGSLRAMLHRSWQEDLGALSSGESVGCLHISCRRMQEHLTSTLENVSALPGLLAFLVPFAMRLRCCCMQLCRAGSCGALHVECWLCCMSCAALARVVPCM